MSNTRGRNNVFVLGHETHVKRMLNSKRADYTFIINFLQRRLNTAYTKKLFWSGSLGGTVFLRERWELTILAGCPLYPQSVIELVFQQGRDTESARVIGRAYADGRIWLHYQALYSMRQGLRISIGKHLDKVYDRVVVEDGTWYHMKTQGCAIARPKTPIAQGESFAEIMNREWRV